MQVVGRNNPHARHAHPTQCPTMLLHPVTVPRLHAIRRPHQRGQQRLGGGTKHQDGDEYHNQRGGDDSGEVGVVRHAVRVKEVVDQRDWGW